MGKHGIRRNALWRYFDKMKHLLLLLMLCIENSYCYRWHTHNPQTNSNGNNNHPDTNYQDNNHYQNGVNAGHAAGHGYLPSDHRIPKDIMVDVINNMGLALLEAHNENNQNNIAISPYGATSVLVALLEGLLGEAAYEIKAAVQLPPELSVVRVGLRDIHRHLKSYFIPKEGFLAGLTLSHENITLNREYQSILKFYGYDIESFNNPDYPDLFTTSMSAATTTTMRSAKTTMPPEMSTTTMQPETTTMESISTIIDKLTSTIGLDASGSGSDGTTDAVSTSTQTVTTSKTKEATDGTTTTEMNGPGETTTLGTTEGTSTTKFPTPDDENVEGTTTKKLPTRSYTTENPLTSTETIDVTDRFGRTETFYPMSTTTLSTEDMPSTFVSEVEGTTSSTAEVTNEELKVTTSGNYEDTSDTDKNARTEEDFDEEPVSTLRAPTSTIDFQTTELITESGSTFYEATTYFPTTPVQPKETTTMSIPNTSTEMSINLGTTLGFEISDGSTLKYDTTTYFPTTPEESSSGTTDSTTSDVPISFTTSIPPTSTNGGITQIEDFVSLTERDNEIVEELSQKLTKLEDGFYPSTSFPDYFSGTSTTESIIPYTQTQITEATSLEDQALEERTEGSVVESNSGNSSTFEISAKIQTKPDGKPLQRRKKRSVIDYLIARYYDNYYINANQRRYLPMTSKTHYSNYQPEEPYTFLVNGKYRETNISFMTYDTILPFYYIRALDAMALSFPLDSNMYYLLLVLPLDEHGIDKLVNDMRKATSLRNIVDHLEYTHVKAVIPSFMLRGYVVLTPTLQKLCIRKIFEPRHADFSQMTPEKNLYVTNIEQAVTVTIRNYVDPASHSARNLNHYRPVEFRADHPFLYFVMDSQIHVNLMAGKIINPLNSRIR